VRADKPEGRRSWWAPRVGSIAQLALLRWYGANVVANFPTGGPALGIAFDGSSMWTVGGNNTVLKLRASDGAALGQFPVGNVPGYIAYDGANVWVSNQGTVSKL
jgi:hypothetical protein